MIFAAEADLQLMAAEDTTGDYGEAVTEALTELWVETEMVTTTPDTRPVHGEL